jgi:hypothetical protein
LVLFLANKLGGAHVGEKMAVRFAAITKMNSLGWGWREPICRLPRRRGDPLTGGSDDYPPSGQMRCPAAQPAGRETKMQKGWPAGSA